MPIDPTGSYAAAPAATTTATKRTSSDELGTDTFLQLMVAQLKYQNPLSPTDGTQFLAQTAQFTMVEKLTALAEQSERLMADNQALGAASLVGRTISWADAAGDVQHGTVTAAAFGSAGATVRVGDLSIPFDQIRDVTS
jgi:flagellar basal-body rod modification protein FlgD